MVDEVVPRNDTYRDEIDGLRALSVGLIILYHLQVFTFHGGFVGVDVFFVISGFLITGLIMNDMTGTGFSFRAFYQRRIARLLPALLVTIVCSLLAGVVVLQPLALIATAKAALAAIFSVSNMWFWDQSGYWGASAQNSVLLHTWSLAVEEQFYLLYPLLLVSCYRLYSRMGVLLLLSALTLLGLATSELVVQTSASAAFFLAPLRFYEFALGGLGCLLSSQLAAIARRRLVASLATLTGLGLILYSALSLSAFSSFPGTNALMPTLGALLVLLSGPSPVARVLLANPLMVWLGKASYSLYLVHWPVIVFYRYTQGPGLSVVDQVVLLLVTIVLGAALNLGVERRFRLSMTGTSYAGLSSGRTMAATALMAVVATGLATILVSADGWPQRLPDNARHLQKLDPERGARENRAFLAAHCTPQGPVFCGQRKAGQPNILLLGDSRGPDLYVALTTAFPTTNILASYAMGCPPVFNKNIGKSIFYENCPELNENRLELALQAPAGDIVFLAMDFNPWRAEFVLETAKKLVAGGKRVYVLGQTGFLRGKSPLEIAIDQRWHAPGDDSIERYLVAAPFNLDDSYAERFAAAGAVYVGCREFFQDGGYRLYTRDGDALLSLDGKHFTLAGAREFGHYLSARYPL